VLFRLIAILCLTVSVAGAQTSRPATDFPRGVWSLTLEGAYAHSFDLSPARIETASMGVGYYFMDNISLNAEAAGFWDQQRGPDSRIAEINLLLRHHVANYGRLSVLIDVGGGLSYASVPTPPGGLYFNFSLQTGPGVTFRLTDRLHLIGGARYLHFSNAAIRGPIHNPSINAMEGYFGLMYTF
jgi:opacity protein-like surface antigen